jgi:hypothetical protein
VVDLQLTFDAISPYNICADRLGLTKTCKPWIATMANWKGKTCHVPETPKDISYYIHSRMAELNSSGNFIVESTREYLPDQKKSVPGYKVTWINCPKAEYRDTTIRIIAWHPFPIMFYPNFNRILARMLELRKISYKFPEGHNNAFEEIGISRNIMMQMSLAVMSLDNLKENFINPVLQNMFPEYANSFIYGNTTINQSEICFDIPTNSMEESRDIIFNWSTSNMKIFHYSNLKWEKGNPIFHFKTEDGLRFKMYGKGKLVRLEFTYDRKYMDKKGLSRRSFEEILRDAEKQFETLDKDTQPIEIRTIIPTRETTKKLNQGTHSLKDIKVLEALSHRSNETFKSMSIQEEIGLTRSMVYYRLSQKFGWLLEKTGRKWTLKKGSIQVITYFLKMIGEVEFLISEMENTLNRTFGIGGIKIIENKTVQQELDRIQDYNSP